MRNRRRPARINVKALVALVLVVAVLLGGAVIGHQVRRRSIARQALAEGKAALAREDWAGACQHLKLYLSKYPDDQEMLGRYAEAHLAVQPRERENLGAALGAYRRLLRHRPGDDEICAQLVKLYAQIGDLDEVVYICRQRLEVDPRDADALLWLARARAAQKRPEEARAAAERLAREHPDESEAYILLSDLAAQTEEEGAAEAALDWLDQGLEHDPQEATLWVRRALLKRSLGHDEQVVRVDLEEAEACTSTNPRVLLQLARAWLAAGELERAEAQITRLEQLEPAAFTEHDTDEQRIAAGRFGIEAELVLCRGATTEAVETAERALAELSDDWRNEFLPLAVQLCVAGNQADRARMHLEEYRRVRTEAAGAHMLPDDQLALLAALVAEAERKPYAVINELEPVRARDPKNALALKYLARAYQDTGQLGRSAGAWREYLALEPADYSAHLALAYIYRNGNPEQALSYAVKAEQLAPDELSAQLLRMELQLETLTEQDADTAVLGELAEELSALGRAHPEVDRIATLQARLAHPRDVAWTVAARLKHADEEGINPGAAALAAAGYLNRRMEGGQGVEVCRRLRGQQPQSAAVHILLAEAQKRAGADAQALSTLREAARGLKGREQLWARLALAEYLLNQDSSAQEGAALRAALEAELRDQDTYSELTTSQRLAAQVALVQLMLRHDDRPRGLALLRRLASEHSDNLNLRVGLLQQPEVQADAAESQLYVDGLRHLEGERGLQWRVEQARLWLRDQEWAQRQSEIEGLLQTLVRAHPELPEPVLVLGGMYEGLQDDPQAAEVYRRCVEADASNVSVANRLLVVLQRLRRFAEAEEILSRFPNELSALSAQRVDVALAQANYAQALEELERRLATDPKDASSRVVLAWWVYRYEGDATRAFELLEEARRIAPDLRAAVSTEARLLRAEGREKEALALLDQEVGKRADFAAYALRAGFLAAGGQTERAERDYTRLTTFADQAADGWAALAGFYLSADRIAEALTACAEGLELDAEHPGLQRVQVRGLLAQSEPQARAQGRDLLTTMLADSPDDPELLLLYSVLLREEGTPEARQEALSALGRVVELQPRNVVAYELLVRTVHALEGKERARARALEGLQLNPQNPVLLSLLAALELDLGNFRAARTRATLAIEVNPDNLDAHNVLVQLALNEGDLEGALQQSRAALQLNAADETVQALHASILFELNRPEEAAEALESYCASEAGLQSVKTRLTLARLYLAQRNFDAVYRVLAEVKTLAPGELQGVSLHWEAWAAQGRFDKVQAALEEYRHPGGRTSANLLRLGAELLAASDADEDLRAAQQVLREVTELEPRHPDAYLHGAELAYRLGEIEEAVDLYGRVLDFEPYQREALNGLAWMLHEKLNRPGEALELADRAVARYPQDPHLLDTRGSILATVGRLADARADLELCVGLTAEVPVTRAQALFHLGQVLTRQGEAETARIRLEEALSVDQEYQVLGDETRQEIARLLAGSPSKPGP